MLEAVGNLWTFPAEVVAITTNAVVKTNGFAVMGAGCAREARNMFPGIDKHLGTLINTHGHRAFNLGLWTEAITGISYRVATYPTKHNWTQESDPNLVLLSAIQLTEMADKFGWASIVLPRPGCGNGQLQWPDVKSFIEPVLDDRFTVISFKE